MWTSRQLTRSAETDTDEPAERPVVFLERNRTDDEDFLEFDVELTRSERARLGSGGGLIGPEDTVFVSHDYHGTPRR
jgi:hypothetical protein